MTMPCRSEAASAETDRRRLGAVGPERISVGRGRKRAARCNLSWLSWFELVGLSELLFC